MDLDDGVMVNSAALWPLLEPMWKDPKKWWKELANAQGRKDYDWSHLAARYFPSRVDEKCRKDPSLAVAHGCFWKYHPEKAYQWELRLKDEIGPDFKLEEKDSDALRAAFLEAHPERAREIEAAEVARLERKAKKRDQAELELEDASDGPRTTASTLMTRGVRVTGSNASAPVSAWLEQKLLSQLNEKKIVVWLDADGAYSGFVDGLRRRAEEKKFPAPVLAFRGSFLELMLALETEGSTIDKPPLLFHLPGFNKEKVRATPLLEMYECGLAWEVNLASLVGEAANGRLPLPEIEAFVKAPGLSLESADAWLGRAGAAGVDTHVEWIARLEPAELINHLTGTSTERPDGVDRALRARAATLFGTTSDWFDWFDQSESTEAIVAWLLCVEFVHDLRRPPKHPNLVGLTSLPPPTVKRCQAEAARLRQQLPERYRDWALTVEARLEGQEKTEPKDLGRIDTFRFEALTIYNGAVEALTRGEYRQVLEWFEAHEAGQGFWIQQDQSRRWAWSLLGEAARLGVALLEAPRPLEGATSLDEAARRYAEIAAPVDRAHRRFEQRHVALFGPLLPEQTRLSEAFEKLRFAWSDWADLLAKDFARICRDAGPLPPPSCSSAPSSTRWCSRCSARASGWRSSSSTRSASRWPWSSATSSPAAAFRSTSARGWPSCPPSPRSG